MISKVFTGHSFGHSAAYVSNKPGAELLDAKGVRAYNHKLMAEDFLSQQGLRPSKKQACFHAVLSFYPGENPRNEKMTAIVREYLDKIGVTKTQYAIFKHTDRAHLHLHILANMVDNDGKPITDAWIGLRGKKAAQALTQKYQLIPAEGKRLDLTHLENLNRSEGNRYKIYQAIAENLPRCQSLADLERLLAAQRIQIQYKYKGQTKELQGISFKIGKDCFKGSQIDRNFSLGNLQKILARQQQTRKIEPNSRTQPGNNSKIGRSHYTEQEPSVIAPLLEHGISDLLAELLKPEVTPQVPGDLTHQPKKKKKKRGIGR